ncbi:MAG: ASCH domain-containing protein [Candidatus Acidiferrales bacterium]
MAAKRKQNSKSKVAVRALSIGQPWAELILRHRKPFEVRSWKTNYRGPLLMHASQRVNVTAAQALGIDRQKLVGGAFVGWAKLVDVRPFTRADAKLLKKRRGDDDGAWEPHLFSWVLKNVRRIKPVPFKGRLGLFTPPASVLRRVRKRRAG